MNDMLMGGRARAEASRAADPKLSLYTGTISRSATDQVWAARIRQGKRLLGELFHAPQIDAHAAPSDHDEDDGRSAILVAPGRNAKSTLLTFGGNAGYLVLSPELQALERTNIIAVRDPKRCFSMCGVAGLGDTYEACRANLRRLIEALGATTVHCFGVSAGGYSALRYGLDLRVDGVLGMSPPTTLNLADDPGATLARYPYLTALYRNRPGIGVDLAPLYAATLPRPEVLLLFAPTHQRDNWLANRMRGIAGVTLEETPEKAGHRVLQSLGASNGLTPYLARLQAMRPLAPAYCNE